ncbi:SPARC-like protein 1 [Lepidochelys kempii]|uniref:SPARC-like protein 1 n=1 Tax=Lepidochelys kempii TaxID=8472 RepID=UPI003C6FE663
MGVMLASDSQENVFERSSSHQSNREHYQFKNDVQKSNTASDDQENPGQGLTVGQEQDTWKYNKNPIGLFENNSEGGEEMEEDKEEETEKWAETGYQDRRQKAHVKIQEDLYRSEQNKDSSQSDAMLRDASQPLQIIKRQDEEFEEADQKEEEEGTEQDQNAEWQSQEDEDRFQDSTQSISDHEEVVKRLNPQKAAACMEASNVEDNSDDNNDDDSNNDADSDEDDFNKSQKKAAYHKDIPPCTDYEVDQFPLRMRDWLKNILMQLYERDLDRSGFLSDKQRSKVKKIYPNEKHLMAGDHPVELLLHDFEKNYHMYVYPVHWQFSQLDRHPGDRLLTHTELAPLRASLAPMEHCITRFFQERDADKNKHVSLKEWCHCFGIKEEDVDENLLF